MGKSELVGDEEVEELALVLLARLVGVEETEEGITRVAGVSLNEGEVTADALWVGVLELEVFVEDVLELVGVDTIPAVGLVRERARVV